MVRNVIAVTRALLIAALSFASATALAAPVTFYFGGTISTSDLTSISVGDSFAGSYTFESTSGDIDPDPQLGIYIWGPPFQATIGSYSFSTPVGTFGGSIQVRDFADASNYDASDTVTSQTEVDGFWAYYWFIQLASESSDALSSDGLPTSPPPLSLFAKRQFQILFCAGACFSTAVVYGDLSYLSLDPPTAVPEPSTYALMLAGLGLLGFMARRRKQ